MKTRLDAELVRRELARSREQAADLIEKRSVLVNGIPATKPATQVVLKLQSLSLAIAMILFPAAVTNWKVL